MKPLALSLLAVATLCTSAFADIQYTTVTSMNQDGKMVPLSTTTTFLKKGLQRDETEQKIGEFKRSEATIQNVAKREQISLDPSLKIYAVQPFGNGGSDEKSDIKVTAVKPSATKGTGKMIMTLGAEFIGNEKLLDYPVRHYKTSMETESSGCCGVGKNTIKSEVWMADLELPVLDTGSTAKTDNPYAGTGGSNCDITFERKGDVAGYDASNKGLALKRIMFGPDGKPMMQQQITLLSLAALDDDRFAAPADFKKLSRADYDKARQNAMMAAMMGGAGNDKDAAPAEDDNDESKPTTDTPDTGDAAESAAKEAGKEKVRRKLRLPF